MEGFQFLGQVAIDGRSKVMSVSLRDLSGTVLWKVDLPPDRRHHWPS